MQCFDILPPHHHVVGLIGPPGAGKTTLIRHFLHHQPNSGMVQSFTTRPPREGDDPREYQYFSAETVDELIADGDVTWCVEAHGNRYGNVYQQFYDALLYYQFALIVVTHDTVPIAWNKLPKERQHYFYLLNPGENELRRRMKERGDSDETIEHRIVTSRHWDEAAIRLLDGGWPVTMVAPGTTEEMYEIICHELGTPA